MHAQEPSLEAIILGPSVVVRSCSCGTRTNSTSSHTRGPEAPSTTVRVEVEPTVTLCSNLCSEGGGFSTPWRAGISRSYSNFSLCIIGSSYYLSMSAIDRDSYECSSMLSSETLERALVLVPISRMQFHLSHLRRLKSSARR